ncbi:unnamed protein product [Dibothriocephalus latus]|uniref:Uncharacterized protein n=1 Tax=Dibothriocephalus latus TaxID=60516 RepID=A0A3P6UP95_DIBLA|nr:unnamed protein product [Dibothriocephalus latus]
MESKKKWVAQIRKPRLRKMIDYRQQDLPLERHDPMCCFVAGIPAAQRDSAHACRLPICRSAKDQLNGNSDWLFADVKTRSCAILTEFTLTQASLYNCA